MRGLAVSVGYRLLVGCLNIMNVGTVKEILVRLAKSISLMAAIWVLSYLLLGFNEAFLILGVAIIWSVIAAFSI